MRQRFKPALLGFLLLLAGCPNPPAECIDGTEPACAEDGGDAPPPIICNTRDLALSDPQCRLDVGLNGAEGQPKEGYISVQGDQDWYLGELGPTTPQSLLELRGGYGAPNTAVNLSLNLLREDGTTSLAHRIDDHGQGAPSILDITVPLTGTDARVLVLVSDKSTGTKAAFDARNPYLVTMKVMANPDKNEPNDVDATPVDLANQAGILVGQQTGFLATDDDVDRFSIVAPAGRKVLYLHLTAPKPTTAPQYRLSYTLLDPASKPIAQGRMDNAFRAADLATARLTTAGSYTLVVQGYQDTTGPVFGDPDLQYTLDVKIMDEVDPNEPNDTSATARKATALTAVGGAQTFTGRLGFVPDPDWYEVDLPANTAPTILYYRVSPAAGGGRFPPLPGDLDRQIKVFREVTGGTAAQNQNDCLTNRTACPASYAEGDYAQGLVEAFCKASNPPKCLWSSREEHVSFPNLRNLEGAIQVPPHTATLKYLVLVDDSGNDFADDKDYTLRLEWRADPDEAARFSGNVEQVATLAMPEVPPASFPTPGPGAAVLSGTLSYGQGFLLNHDPNNGEGVRGPHDYDSQVSDTDSWSLTLPAVDAGFLDRTWELQWDVQNLDGGAPPYDLGLDVTFCDGEATPGTCTEVGPTTLSYVGDPLTSWHGGSPWQPIYDRASVGGVTTVTARAYGCFCIEPRFMKGGTLTVKVQAVDRTDYTPMPYSVRTSLTAYPQSYALAAGGTKSCPAPTLDIDGGSAGGCGFTR